MSVSTTHRRPFSRNPLAALDWICLLALLSGAIFCGTLKILVGPGSIPLIYVALTLFIGALIVLTGLRWTPVVGSLLSGSIFFVFCTQPYTIYHLTNPQPQFLFFLDVLFILVCLLIAFFAGILATFFNYRAKRLSFYWLTSIGVGILGLLIGIIFMGTISSSNEASSTPSANSEPVVHMVAGNFAQSSVTISKGSKLLLIDDGAIPHILANGSWITSTSFRATRETNAPLINNVQTNGNNTEIGPFNIPGTYHIYCTIHPGMNLTVTVD